MIIDAILDRKHGELYDPKKFYNYIRAEEHIFGFDPEISLALDYGDNADIQKALCNYVIAQDYNPKICDYINSVDWLTKDTITVHRFNNRYGEFTISEYSNGRYSVRGTVKAASYAFRSINRMPPNKYGNFDGREKAGFAACRELIDTLK